VNTKTVWNINKFLPSPIITISEEDLMKLYSETTAREYKMDRESWKKEREKNNTLYRLNIDHRIKFLDSSIWHRFVSEKDGSGSIGIVDQNKEFKQKIKETCISMCDYWEMGLYNTNVGLAALEFQCRMFLQSWLFPIGHRDHQDVVTPFKFHSESEAVKNVHELLHFLKSEGNGELKMSNLEWHLLMVDDQATKPISSIDNNSCTITKANLIRYLIQGHKPAGFDGDLSIRDGLQKAMIVEQTGRGDEDKGIVRQVTCPEIGLHKK
jgi:hypothetical protein